MLKDYRTEKSGVLGEKKLENIISKNELRKNSGISEKLLEYQSWIEGTN